MSEATGRHSGADASDPRRPIQRALISVYDKTGLADLARGLAGAGAEIVSTGSTAGKIEAAGVPVTRVEELTGFPECLDGRVKTLHPKVHAGLLADLRLPDHAAQLDQLGVEPFDLLVVNLYPFAETVASGAAPDECVEQIDIGGPAMVRAAAKNHASVAVVTDPARYPDVLAAAGSGGFTFAERRGLAVEAFRHTATYDVAVASWLGDVAAPSHEGFPPWLGATWTRKAALRYGENPHQQAALYESGPAPTPQSHAPAPPQRREAVSWSGGPGLAQAEQLHGKEMSYNNYVDADAARRAAYDFTQPCVAIVKHANPCGIAIASPDGAGQGSARPDADSASSGADPIAEAHRRAHECDPVSAFGGVIAANRPVSAAMARQVAEVFTEVVVAPDFDPDAIEILTRKKNVRLLRAGAAARGGVELRPISGGLLLQSRDAVDAPGDSPSGWTLAAGEAADADTLADLEFAWRAVRAVKSNAILLAASGATVGVGMGQVNRVDSVRLAVSRAGERAAGSVAASDAYFPFPDGLQVLLDARVRAVAQPGGSVRDEEVVAAAKAAGVTMYLTGARHFFH